MRLHINTGLGTAYPVTATTQAIASTIQQVEGYYPGSLAYINNNPGNLIYTSYYAQAYGAVPGAGGFSKFPDYQTGLNALYHQIGVDAGQGMTISQMMNVWAPAGQGGNDPTAYAQTVANALGVTPDTVVNSIDLGGGSGQVVGTGAGDGSGAGSGAGTVDPVTGDWTTGGVLDSGTTDWGTVGLLAAGVVGLILFTR